MTDPGEILKTPLIKLENVTKIFDNYEVETHALCGVHLQVSRCEYVAITGPSGCGKSTLLSIIGLLDVPTRGRYFLEDCDMVKTKAADRTRIRNRNIGFIFQAFNLIGDLTVFENIALPLIYREMTAKERNGRVMQMLDLVEMTHRYKHYPTQLSGGQQQRVAVARALVGNPSILLADEPTGNLDSHNSAAILDILREVHRNGTTICMVTHDDRYARYAERTVRMFDGRVVEESAA
ncbi:ABC transporter ATP-binding protein [bacterium]|nr:ABC transporter ATP-binding protein [candidate division CSSED10-310 bacterium]